MMGIDQLLQQKMDTGRQNPQALMQSYQQNQSLLDLLALQKLKSEKEAAQRDMMLKAGQSGTPPTVAQQREQELLGMNKAEIAQQAAGSMQHQQAQQEQALQRLAQSGIANLPAQGMAQMAEGGIVGYQRGGNVSRLEKLTQQLIEAGMEPEAAREAAQKTLDRGAPFLPRVPGLPGVPNLLPDPTAPARAAGRGLANLYEALPDQLGGTRDEDFRPDLSAAQPGDPSTSQTMGDEEIAEFVESQQQRTARPSSRQRGGRGPRLTQPEGMTDEEIVGTDGQGNPIYASQLEQIVGGRHTGLNLPENIAFLGDGQDGRRQYPRVDVLAERLKGLIPSIDTEGTNLGRVREALSEGDYSPITKATAYPTAVLMDFLNTQRGIGEDIGRGIDLAKEGVDVALRQAGEGVNLGRGTQAQPAAQAPAQAPVPAVAAEETPAPPGQGIDAIPVARPQIPGLDAVTQDPLSRGEPFRMQGVRDAPTPAEYVLSRLPTPERAAQMEAESAPAGLSALQQEIQRRMGRRDDKLDYLSRFMMGMAGSTSPGSAMQRGSAMARGIEGQEEAILRDLMTQQERVELEQRRLEEMGLDRESRERIEAERTAQMALDRDETRKSRLLQQSEVTVNRALGTLMQVANLTATQQERYNSAMREGLGEIPTLIAAIDAELATNPGRSKRKELTQAREKLEAQGTRVTENVDKMYGNDETAAQLQTIQMQLFRQLARMGEAPGDDGFDNMSVME